MRILIKDIEADKAQFEAIHGKGLFLGSSEIATAAGLNRFQTRLQLWHKKTGRDLSQPDNIFIKLGNYLEPVVARLFTDERKEWIAEKNNTTYQHRTLDWATCTPDYFLSYPINVDAEALLEIKTSGIWAADEWKDGSVPDWARIQVIWQLGIMELPRGYIAALIGGNQFYQYEIEFNRDVFDQLVQIGEKFLQHVKDDIPPDATYSDDFSSIFPTEKEVDLSEFKDLAEQYELLQKEAKEVSDLLKLKEQAKDTIKAQIMQKMGDASVAKIGNYLATRKVIEYKESLRKAYSSVRFNFKKLGE